MLKIFLAEDEVIVRETIKRMIPWEDLGFELVGEAADGEMALPLLLRQKPDLLITDIKMPFMDGLTLAKVAKKEIPGLKVVILSGYDDFNYAKQAINIGVEDYLLKPITKNALIERLTEIRSRYEHEKTQKEYYEKFHREMQAYVEEVAFAADDTVTKVTVDGTDYDITPITQEILDGRAYYSNPINYCT